ncbi:SHD1 domain-containing protein [Prosthecobacter sp. SYSU 5D2]|uniref:SHD1 domain-containing protein n=1 Tax=Prosthecobacter sp. SYSU 5D2 TaxID=3134134 RepID=UPI0031FED9BA
MQKTILCLCLVTLCCLPLAGHAASRAWTDDTGRKVEAEYAGVQGDSVMLKLPAGNTVPFPLARLSAEDQAFVKAQGAAPASAPAPAALADPKRLPMEKRTWPGKVEVSARSLEIKAVHESVAERKYVYQSEAFEFQSQAKLAASVMKEVARTFEATRALVEALPWGIVCHPPDGRPRFLAALYESRQDYFDAGGPENSGGVYSSGDKIFKIPFPSLGLEKRGQTYFKNDGYSNGTLVHEITHQLMDEYLGFLPTWVIEGTAEYTEMLPLNAGTFRADAHKNAMKEDITHWEKQEGFPAEIGSLETHMTMSRDKWMEACSTPEQMRIMYHRSQLLVYFFSHLDGDAKGTRFIRYMDAVHGEVAAMRAFFDDPRVKRMDGGRFTYPRDMKPPAMRGEAVFKHLPILLEERPYAKIASEIVEGYKSIGVKVKVE